MASTGSSVLPARRRGRPSVFHQVPDPCLAHRNGYEPSERVSLFRLSLGLLQLIQSDEVAAILEATAFGPAGAEALLDFFERLDWSLPERSDFVWYSLSRGCSLPMPHWDGVSAEADDWYEPLLEAVNLSHGAVIPSGDGWGADVSSFRPPYKQSNESLLVTAAFPSPPPGEAAGVDPSVVTTEGPPFGPSTQPVIDEPNPTGSPQEIEEETGAGPAQAASRRAAPTVGPTAEDSTVVPPI